MLQRQQRQQQRDLHHGLDRVFGFEGAAVVDPTLPPPRPRRQPARGRGRVQEEQFDRPPAMCTRAKTRETAGL